MLLLAISHLHFERRLPRWFMGIRSSLNKAVAVIEVSPDAILFKDLHAKRAMQCNRVIGQRFAKAPAMQRRVQKQTTNFGANKR